MAKNKLRFNKVGLSHLFKGVIDDVMHWYMFQLREEVPKDTKTLMRSIRIKHILARKDEIKGILEITQPYARKQALETLHHLPNYSHAKEGSISNHPIVRRVIGDRIRTLKQRIRGESGKKAEKTSALIDKINRLKGKQTYRYGVGYRALMKEGALVKVATMYHEKAFEKLEIEQKLKDLVKQEKIDLVE